MVFRSDKQALHIFFFKKTQAGIISDTVFFKHKYIRQPTLMHADGIIKALSDLKAVTSEQSKHSSNATLNSLQQIDETITPTNRTIQELTQNPKQVHFKDPPATRVVYNFQ